MADARIHTALAALAFMVAFAAAASVARAAVVSELRVDSNGIVIAKNIVVIQRAGTNLFARAVWGQAFVRLTVLSSASTTVSRKHGETMTVSAIKEGDVLDVEGALSTSADSIMVNAKSIRDISQERETKTLSGLVESVNTTELSFMLLNGSFGLTKISLSASTPITKGMRSIELTDIAPGDRVVSVSGTYDYAAGSMRANAVEIYQDKAMFQPRNFQGTLKNVSLTTPALLGISVSGTDYTVYVPPSATILSKNRNPAALTRFVKGDTIRFWGGIRESNFTEIDASIVRDLDF